MWKTWPYSVISQRCLLLAQILKNGLVKEMLKPLHCGELGYLESWYIGTFWYIGEFVYLPGVYSGCCSKVPEFTMISEEVLPLT